MSRASCPRSAARGRAATEPGRSLGNERLELCHAGASRRSKPALRARLELQPAIFHSLPRRCRGHDYRAASTGPSSPRVPRSAGPGPAVANQRAGAPVPLPSPFRDVRYLYLSNERWDSLAEIGRSCKREPQHYFEVVKAGCGRCRSKDPRSQPDQSRKGKEEGEVHIAPPPHQHRTARRCVLRAKGKRRTGHRWPDLAGIRAEPRAQSRGAACSHPSGSVSGTAVTAGLHTQAGWTAATARGCGPGGQDRPTGDGRGAQRDLRGLPRVLVRIPARARHARRAGRACRRDREQEGELDIGRRHPIVLGSCFILPTG
jgi:hypothetical protein